MTVLELDGVTKRYDDRDVVSDITLALSAGEKLALLGHNGAGKSTLIRLILGLAPIDGGGISIAGAAPGTAEARRLTAYLPETVAFHRLLSGREQLRAFARMKGEALATADDLLERVGLARDGNRRIGTYSKGMRQRLGLAQALIGRPRLVLLDEPTSGLDPVARWDFYGIIDQLAADGAAVLLSSHALTEIEARTDRIAMLRAGSLVAEGSLETLRRRAALPIRLRVAGHDHGVDALVAELGGRRINGRSIEVLCTQSEKLERIAAITSLGGLVDDVEVSPPSLDDLYRHFSSPEA